jgi:hypothetical protein
MIIDSINGQILGKYYTFAHPIEFANKDLKQKRQRSKLD